MTADQKKIKALFLEHLETVTDPAINKKALQVSAFKVISMLTPAAAQNILESHDAEIPLQDRDIDDLTTPEANRLILQLLDLKTDDGIPLLYKPVSSGAAGQHAAKSIIELVDYALVMLNDEVKPMFENGIDEADDELKQIIFAKHEAIIKKLITLLWDNGEELPPEAYKAELLKLATPPEKHIMPINKLANTITTAKGFNLFDINGADLIVSAQGKKEITTRCMLTYEGDNITLSGRQPFTEYDRNVADAVTSLYEYGGSNIITAATVYRAMVNMTDTETPSQQQIGAVTRSLDKMRFTRVRIDCTEELKQRKVSLNGKQITGGLADTYLLAMESIEIEAGGQRVKAYKIIKTPILYEYAQITKQVITAPSKLLAIPKQSNTEKRISIKSYLLRRIYGIKGKSRLNPHILFSTMYEDLDMQPTKDDKKRNKSYIDSVLKYWKEEKFIKDYSFTKSGREYDGIMIRY